MGGAFNSFMVALATCFPLVSPAETSALCLSQAAADRSVGLPLLGFGTAGLGDSTESAVRLALEAGYRLFDSAQAREWYREDLVGRALDFRNASGHGARRGSIFVTTKLHPRHHGREEPRRQLVKSLADLGTSYVDAYLLHYAECYEGLQGCDSPTGHWTESWLALQRLVDEGLVRVAGVSNFRVAQLEKLWALPWGEGRQQRRLVVQNYVSPLHPDAGARRWCAAHMGCVYQGFSVLGTQELVRARGGAGAVNPVLSSPVIARVGARAGGSSGLSPAQTVLCWAMQRGIAVIPRSSRRAHIRANAALAQRLVREAGGGGGGGVQRGRGGSSGGRRAVVAAAVGWWDGRDRDGVAGADQRDVSRRLARGDLHLAEAGTAAASTCGGTSSDGGQRACDTRDGHRGDTGGESDDTSHANGELASEYRAPWGATNPSCADSFQGPSSSPGGGAGGNVDVASSPPQPPRYYYCSLTKEDLDTIDALGAPLTASCEDGHQHCAAWAAARECQQNPAYMLEHCRRSCGMCPESLF